MLEATSRRETTKFPGTAAEPGIAGKLTLAALGCENVCVSSKTLVLIGWLLFTVSGVFFLIDALESGDKTAIGSALTWIVGVLFFIAAGRTAPEGPNT